MSVRRAIPLLQIKPDTLFSRKPLQRASQRSDYFLYKFYPSRGVLCIKKNHTEREFLPIIIRSEWEPERSNTRDELNIFRFFFTTSSLGRQNAVFNNRTGKCIIDASPLVCPCTVLLLVSFPIFVYSGLSLGARISIISELLTGR